MNPLISFIIPVLELDRVKNPKRFFMPKASIRDVLDNIDENVSCDYEIIIVCNGQDETLTKFICGDSRVTRYCLNSDNVGVARAWNMGAQLASGEVLCYLNDDIKIKKNSIEGLVTQLLSSETIGQVGPEGSFWEDCKHKSFSEGTGWQDCDVISGFCFLLRSSTFHEIGGFDINYSPAGYEEIDLSYRIRELGLTICSNSSILIKHFKEHGVSARKMDISYLGQTIDTVSLNERNYQYFKSKWLKN